MNALIISIIIHLKKWSYYAVVGIVTRLWYRLSCVQFLAEVSNFSLVVKVQMTLRLTQSCFDSRGCRKSRAIPLLLLWAFVACYRVNFTFYF